MTTLHISTERDPDPRKELNGYLQSLQTATIDTTSSWWGRDIHVKKSTLSLDTVIAQFSNVVLTKEFFRRLHSDTTPIEEGLDARSVGLQILQRFKALHQNTETSRDIGIFQHIFLIFAKFFVSLFYPSVDSQIQYAEKFFRTFPPHAFNAFPKDNAEGQALLAELQICKSSTRTGTHCYVLSKELFEKCLEYTKKEKARDSGDSTSTVVEGETVGASITKGSLGDSQDDDDAVRGLMPAVDRKGTRNCMLYPNKETSAGSNSDS
ncbi:MAG: hypothetical protein AAGF04_00135 [Chlamydiota bacterium]